MKQPLLTKLDPRTKGFSLLLISVLTLVSTNWIQLAFVTVVMLAAVPASGQRIGRLAGRLRKVFWFVLIIVCLNAATVSGRVIFQVWGCYITSEGILAGTLLSARIVILLWASSIFLWCTPVLDILDGIESLPGSLHLPTGRGIVSMSIALNFVPLLIRSAKTVKLAQLARGAEEATGFFAQVRNTSMLALPLFAGVFRSADILADAMDSRCYALSRQRSRYRTLKLADRDWRVLTGITLFALLFFLAG